MIPTPFEQMVRMLARLPAIGRRSAERIAFKLIRQNETLLTDLTASLNEAHRLLCSCSRCGAVTLREKDPCGLCTDSTRDPVICLVEDAADVEAIEEAGGFHGRYHVLGGKLSPMKGTGPGDLRLNLLKQRIGEEHIREVVIALNTDVESDATAHFLRDQLAPLGVRCTRLAFGLPAGSGVEYADAVTLSRAMRGRSDWS
ncbi:MAG: recombination mediator RecR [Kiritimatiellae bacterium]|nr:recombination mediator RecR [Kiritimatiellia bacterium]